MEITCIKCLELKDENEFDRDKKKINGRDSRCKVCKSAAMKEHRAIPEVKERNAAKNKEYRAIPEVKERNATRVKEQRAIPEVKERNAARIKEWNQTDVGRASHKKADDRRLATPEGQQKYRARAAVRSAVETGDMIKPERCEMQNCQEEKVEAHHLRYEPEHWLDVLWLCRRHHMTADKLYPITSQYKPVDWNLNALTA